MTRRLLALGDRVRGTTYIEPENRARQRPEQVEGTVVQLGSGWPQVDATLDYVWVKLPDCTERRVLVEDARIIAPADRTARRTARGGA